MTKRTLTWAEKMRPRCGYCKRLLPRRRPGQRGRPPAYCCRAHRQLAFQSRCAGGAHPLAAALLRRDIPDRLTVTAALRLPQARLRQQFALIDGAPPPAYDLLVFDQSGLGDAAAELLPKTPPHMGVCLVGGDRPLTRSARGDRLVVGKSWLVQRLGAAMRSGEMTVAEHAPGRHQLRRELAQF